MFKIILIVTIFILINCASLSTSQSNLASFISSLLSPQKANYKLRYFNIRGRAEFLRYMFAYANQDYTDDRIENEDWPQIKPTMPFGQIPVLEIRQSRKVDVIAQSSAIGIIYLILF